MHSASAWFLDAPGYDDTVVADIDVFLVDDISLCCVTAKYEKYHKYSYQKMY